MERAKSGADATGSEDDLPLFGSALIVERVPVVPKSFVPGRILFIGPLISPLNI